MEEINFFLAIKQALIGGELVLLQTDTVIGIACLASCKEYLAKLYDVKQRKLTQPIAIFLPSLKAINQYATITDNHLKAFIKRLIPGPYTVLLNPSLTCPEYLIGPQNKVGIRIITSPKLNQFLSTLEYPLAVTSANLSGEEPYTNFDEAKQHFSSQIYHHLLLNDVAPSNQPSTLIDLSSTIPIVLRDPGSLSGQLYTKWMNSANICFVCIGNTCRSPFAQYYFDLLLANRQLDWISVSSFGLNTIDGRTAANVGIEVAKQYQVELANHRTRNIQDQYVRDASLLITMTQEQKQFLTIAYPQYEHKIFSLGDFSETPEDVMDPFGGSSQDYNQTYHQIKTLLDSNFNSIIEQTTTLQGH